MTDSEIIAYVELNLGGEFKTAISRPMIIAMATLAYKDLAEYLLMTDSELSKKLVTTVTNQTWSNSSFSAPSNMLFMKQRDTVKMSIGGTLAFQIEDRDRLDMSSSLSNIYYVLEGKTFYIKHPTLTTGMNLDLTYYKIPANSDIDNELRNLFISILIKRLIPSPPEPPKK